MITAADQLLILESLVTTISAETGYRVLPSPEKFVDKRDFLASDETVVSTDRDTQDKMDAIDVAAVWCFFRGWSDVPGSPEDSPIKYFNYDLVFFKQKDRERLDENDTFEKTILKNYNDIITAVFNLQYELQGSRNLGVLDPARYAIQETTSLIVQQELEYEAQCEFIPGILGYRIVLREAIRVQLVEC